AGAADVDGIEAGSLDEQRGGGVIGAGHHEAAAAAAQDLAEGGGWALVLAQRAASGISISGVRSARRVAESSFHSQAKRLSARGRVRMGSAWAWNFSSTSGSVMGLRAWPRG